LYSPLYHFLVNGLSDAPGLSGLSIIQNDKKLKIRISAYLPAYLHIYNIAGQAVLTKQIDDADTEIELNSLMSGIYLAILENSQLKLTKKIMIY
jgi:hypothetical protein